MTSTTKYYSELVLLATHLERFEYLSLRGSVGCATFGFDRWINQQFYTSRAWRTLRRDVIARDNGCDLGIEGFEIHSRVYVHHMNPLVEADIVNGTDNALNPEYLITVTHDTHNAIHYGNSQLLSKPHISRIPGDTKLW
jgi:hypothetical protein